MQLALFMQGCWHIPVVGLQVVPAGLPAQSVFEVQRGGPMSTGTSVMSAATSSATSVVALSFVALSPTPESFGVTSLVGVSLGFGTSAGGFPTTAGPSHPTTAQSAAHATIHAVVRRELLR